MTLTPLNRLKDPASTWADSMTGDDIEILSSPLLEKCEEIIHAFTMRCGGVSPPPFDSLNLSAKTGDNELNIRENIDRLSEKLSINEEIFFLEQVHGNKILTVGGNKASNDNRKFDAVISNSRNIPLAILTADCLPILIYDPQKKAVGAVHAGWRGTAQGIVEKTIIALKDNFACRVNDMIVAMGPSIGPCCYEVDQYVLDAFLLRGEAGLEEWNRATESCLKDSEQRWAFNISEANRVQLLRAGVKENNISSLSCCTCCRGDLFFSYRRDGAETGRLASIIMIKEGTGK